MAPRLEEAVVAPFLGPLHSSSSWGLAAAAAEADPTTGHEPEPFWTDLPKNMRRISALGGTSGSSSSSSSSFYGLLDGQVELGRPTLKRQRPSAFQSFLDCTQEMTSDPSSCWCPSSSSSSSSSRLSSTSSGARPGRHLVNTYNSFFAMDSTQEEALRHDDLHSHRLLLEEHADEAKLRSRELAMEEQTKDEKLGVTSGRQDMAKAGLNRTWHNMLVGIDLAFGVFLGTALLRFTLGKARAPTEEAQVARVRLAFRREQRQQATADPEGEARGRIRARPMQGIGYDAAAQDRVREVAATLETGGGEEEEDGDSGSSGSGLW